MNLINAQLNCFDKNKKFVREVSCFATPEHGIISLTTDDCGGAVDFGWEEIWGFLRNQKEKPSCAIMMHTHPEGHNQMSSIDRNMVQGWRLGLGIPIEFNIVTKTFRTGWIHEIAHYTCLKIDGRTKTQFHSWIPVQSLDNENYKILSYILYGLSMEEKLEDFEESKKQLLNANFDLSGILE